MTRNSEAEKGTAGRLSTRTGREAWKQAERKGKATGTKGTVAHRGTHCEGEAGRREKKKQRPSSEMLKRKRTKGSGSQALIPEEKSKREAPVEQLWERNWEGRKETNRKPSTRNRKEGMGNQAGHKGKDLGSESGTEAPKKPAVRRKREETWKGRTDRLSSEMLKRKQTKGSGSQAPIPEGKPKREAPVERLWERSREGRKETNRKLSKQNRKEADGKPAVDEGEKQRGRKEPEPGRRANCEAEGPEGKKEEAEAE